MKTKEQIKKILSGLIPQKKKGFVVLDEKEYNKLLNELNKLKELRVY